MQGGDIVFQSITNMNQFIDMEKLTIDWNQKKKNSSLSPLDQMAADTDKMNKMNSITGKLMRGKRLSPKEKEYLAQHAPELHKKAIAAEAERRAYKEALKNCRTKEDVEQLHSQKLSEIMVVEKKDPEAAMIKEAAIADEHAAFTKTSDYQSIIVQEQAAKQKSQNNEEDKHNIEKRIAMKTKQERHDMTQEMLDSEQKLHFTMQNYSAQAQIKEIAEKNEAASMEAANASTIPGNPGSARAFMQSKGIALEGLPENFVSFSSITHPANNSPSQSANSAAPVAQAVVSRAHAAYQSAAPQTAPEVPSQGPSLKTKA